MPPHGALVMLQADTTLFFSFLFMFMLAHNALGTETFTMHMCCTIVYHLMLQSDQTLFCSMLQVLQLPVPLHAGTPF